MKKGRFTSTAVAAILALTGCHEKSKSNSQAAAPSPKPAVSPSPTATPAKPAPFKPAPDTDSVAKESFLKTYAAGAKKWNLKNVVVEFTKSTTAENGISTVAEQWVADCETTHATELRGDYPQVNAYFGGLDCANHQLDNLGALFLMSSFLYYTAVPNPAGNDYPNQFRLDLNPPYGLFAPLKSDGALNAHLEEHYAFLDFKAEDHLGPYGPETNYYMEITMSQDADTGAETLLLRYQEDGYRESEIVTVKADMERVK